METSPLAHAHLRMAPIMPCSGGTGYPCLTADQLSGRQDPILEVVDIKRRPIDRGVWRSSLRFVLQRPVVDLNTSSILDVNPCRCRSIVLKSAGVGSTSPASCTFHLLITVEPYPDFISLRQPNLMCTFQPTFAPATLTAQRR